MPKAKLAVLEHRMPKLLSELRADLNKNFLVRRFRLLKKNVTYTRFPDEFVYYYEDHRDLNGMCQILANHGLVLDTGEEDPKAYILLERLAEYLTQGTLVDELAQDHEEGRRGFSQPIVAMEPADSVTKETTIGDCRKAIARRGRGFAADASDHRKVAAGASMVGDDWTTRLPQLCRELDKIGAELPEYWREKESAESWEEIAEAIEGPGKSSARERVIKYVKYRINWVRKNSL